jgi:catechol 2,3-dioxygenase-like lactoylglutathione lyase family enzyme
VTDPKLQLNRIDHVGVVVDDLAEACALLTERFGLEPTDTIDREDLRAVFFPCGETRVELLEILEPEARKRRLGDGTARIEHIAFEVDDVQGTLAILETLGIEANGPMQQSAGRDTFWTAPNTSDGVMYQFIAAS